MKKQNKNFLYNIAYQLLTFIIPLILTPYISRVLGSSNIGIYSYTYSIVNYFMLFTMLGINNYGSREIAKCKNRQERSRKFVSIRRLQLSCGLIAAIVYAVLLLAYNYEHKEIMAINSIFLLSAILDINWFYFGIEKFKLTTTRNMIIKILSVGLIFLFVKQDNQLWLYSLILSSSTIISQIYMWLFIKKEIDFVKVSKEEVLAHLKPCLVFFIPVISYSIYRVMDKTMIGAIVESSELGNYENAEKIISIPISLVTALGTVMLPHMSKKNNSEIKEGIYETFKLSAFFTIPSAIALAIIAQDFSTLFFGDDFDKAGTIIQALVCTIVFSGIANVIRTNFLIPLKKDKIYVVSTIIGAALNLVLNIIFIPMFGAYGACIGTIVAEFSLMLYQAINTARDISYMMVIRIYSRSLLTAIIMGGAMWILSLMSLQALTRIIIQLIAGALVYCLLNINFILVDFLNRKKKPEVITGDSNDKKQFRK